MRAPQPCGQGELKRCAARGIVRSPQTAAVRFNNGAADPQPMPVP